MSKININQKIKDFTTEKIEDLKTVKGDLDYFAGDKIREILGAECLKKVKKIMDDKGTKEEVLTLKFVLIESLFSAYKDDALVNKEGKIDYNVTPEDNYNKSVIGRKIAWASQRKKFDIDLDSTEVTTAKKMVYRKYFSSPMVMGQVYDMLDNKKHDFEENKKNKGNK